jgi:hypothetical protein
MKPDIAGYDFGTDRVAHSPVTLAELAELQQALGWTPEDASWLSKAAPILTRHAEDLVNDWRAQIGKLPFLSQWFGTPGEATDKYRAAVKKRFVQWVIDTCTRPQDQAWLDYAHEIGLRHTPEKKNMTDGAHSPSVMPLRYLITFAWPVITRVRSYLGAEVSAPADVNAMQAAWAKSVLIQIALWSRPYVHEGWW